MFSQTSPQSPESSRRALPAPLDGIFPGSDYLGPTPLIGVPDTDPVYPLTKAVWAIAPPLKDARIKVYGWINPGISVSTSNKSNIPESYAIVPNRLELDQGVLRIDRLPDTVQTEHLDWGFRLTPMYGIDYPWTTSQGWFSGHRHHLAILDLGSYRTGPRLWRTLDPVESVVGVPMCGLFASFLFAIVTRLVEREARLLSQLANPVTMLRPAAKDSNLSGFSYGGTQRRVLITGRRERQCCWQCELSSSKCKYQTMTWL